MNLFQLKEFNELKTNSNTSNKLSISITERISQRYRKHIYIYNLYPKWLNVYVWPLITKNTYLYSRGKQILLKES